MFEAEDLMQSFGLELANKEHGMIVNTLIKRMSFCRYPRKIKYDIEILSWLNERDNKFFRFCLKVLKNKMIKTYASEIDAGANIHRTVRFYHVTGIVIGCNAVIKENVSLYQNITIGANVGINEDKGKGMPTIERNTIIYAGAVVIGDIIVGENSIIAANSVVSKNVPPNSLVTGFNKIKTLETT